MLLSPLRAERISWWLRRRGQGQLDHVQLYRWTFQLWPIKILMESAQWEYLTFRPGRSAVVSLGHALGLQSLPFSSFSTSSQIGQRPGNGLSSSNHTDDGMTIGVVNKECLWEDKITLLLGCRARPCLEKKKKTTDPEGKHQGRKHNKKWRLWL